MRCARSCLTAEGHLAQARKDLVAHAAFGFSTSLITSA